MKVKEARRKMSNILEAKGIYKAYEFSKGIFTKKIKQNVLENFSFDLVKGEILGIVGKSGAGKSTLIKCLTGIEEADAGEIVIDSKKVFEKELGNKAKINSFSSLEIKKKIQIIMQDPYTALSPKRKVSSLALEALKLYEPNLSSINIRKRVEDYFLMCGLRKEYMDAYPHELSGGQSQRVCIASALVLSPKIVICDEITSALDLSVQAKILNLMLDLREKLGLTYIFISHNLELVDCLCDRKLELV